jgi:PAS domain S-box-containing protein
MSRTGTRTVTTRRKRSSKRAAKPGLRPRQRRDARSDASRAESEPLYRQLFEMVSDWFWESDATGRLTYISAKIEAIFGTPASAYIGKRVGEVEGFVIDRDAGRANIQDFKARRPYRDLIYGRKIASGKIIWVASSGAPFYDEDGTFRGYRGVSKNVSAQVEADNALRESEHRFRQLFEIASDYFWETDTDQRMSYLSDNYESVFGIPAAQMIGKRLTDTPGLSVDPEMGKMAVTAIKARQPYRDFFYSRKRDDGTTQWIKVSGIPMFEKDGTFLGYRGVAANVTTHVEALQAARLAQRELHDAVEHITQPLVFYDAEDRAVSFNQAFTDLNRAPNVKWPALQGMPFRELAQWQVSIGFYAAEGQQAVTAEALVEHYESERPHTCRLQDGRWMMVIYRRLPGGGRIGVWTDVTDLKRMEAERRALERQLHHSQRLESLGTLAGGVAHEINNALVPVVALTQMVMSKLPEESRERRNLRTVLTGAERSRDLVKQIMSFSRKEEEGEQQERRSLEMGDVLREALGMLRASLPTTIRLAEAIVPAPPVLGDRSELHQVIINVVTNAAQAIGAAHGTVTVGLAPDPDGRHVRVSIEDTGCGMSEATKARIFEPFFTTKEVGQGTGLGLSVVHGIVTEHGGRIEVDSAPGRGTRFDVILPSAAVETGVAPRARDRKQ